MAVMLPSPVESMLGAGGFASAFQPHPDQQHMPLHYHQQHHHLRLGDGHHTAAGHPAAPRLSQSVLDEFDADGPFGRRQSALAAFGIQSYSELRRRSSAMQVEAALGRPPRSGSNRSQGMHDPFALADLEELAQTISEELGPTTSDIAEHGSAAHAYPLKVDVDAGMEAEAPAAPAAPAWSPAEVEAGADVDAVTAVGYHPDGAALGSPRSPVPAGPGGGLHRANSLPARASPPFRPLPPIGVAGFGRSVSAEEPLAPAPAPVPALTPIVGPAPCPILDATDPNRGRWDAAVLALSTVELNAYLKKQRIGGDEARELKAYRRKVKNRAYTKRSRVKRALREGKEMKVKVDPEDHRALFVDALHVIPRRSSKKRAKTPLVGV